MLLDPLPALRHLDRTERRQGRAGSQSGRRYLVADLGTKRGERVQLERWWRSQTHPPHRLGVDGDGQRSVERSPPFEPPCTTTITSFTRPGEKAATAAGAGAGAAMSETLRHPAAAVRTTWTPRRTPRQQQAQCRGTSARRVHQPGVCSPKASAVRRLGVLIFFRTGCTCRHTFK